MKKVTLLLIYLVLVMVMMNYFVSSDLDIGKLPFVISKPENDEPTVDDTIQVSITRKQEVISVPLEEYLIGVVGSEMPASFELEALKAQSVAARTFAVSRNYKVDDSTATQAYHNEAELKKIWGSSYQTRITKIKEAVSATAGEIMTYQGKIISALYFSTSNGKTANSEEYYASALPYLRSVDSPWDLELNPDAEATKFFSDDQLKNTLGMAKTVSSFKIVDRFQDDRVKTVSINDKTFTGREIRELLGLRSSDFTVRKTKNGYEFTTQGYGHGVGMSQYGAQGMALEGNTYRDILSHYYQNIEIISLSQYKE